MIVYPKNAFQALLLTILILIIPFGLFVTSLKFPIDNEDLNLLCYSFLGIGLNLVLFKFLKLKYTFNSGYFFKNIDYKLLLKLAVLSILANLIAYPYYLVFQTTIQQSSSVPFWLISVVVAPFFEEFFFRGIIFGGLLKNKSFAYSIVTTTLIFIFLHFQLKSILPLLFLSIITCLVFLMTRNIIYPIICHLAFNFTGLILPYITTEFGYSFFISTLSMLFVFPLSRFFRVSETLKNSSVTFFK